LIIVNESGLLTFSL